MTFLDQFKKMAPAFEADIMAVLKKHGLVLRSEKAPPGRRIGGKFGPSTGTLKLDIAPVGANPGADDFKQYASMFYPKASWLGETISLGGKKFKVSGLNPKKRAKPVMVTEISTGKECVTSTDAVILQLGSDEQRKAIREGHIPFLD